MSDPHTRGALTAPLSEAGAPSRADVNATLDGIEQARADALGLTEGLTDAQLAAADIEAAAHHLTMAYDAINRAKARVESALLMGRLARSGRAAAGALGAIHAAQYAIRGGHHR